MDRRALLSALAACPFGFWQPPDDGPAIEHITPRSGRNWFDEARQLAVIRLPLYIFEWLVKGTVLEVAFSPLPDDSAALACYCDERDGLYVVLEGSGFEIVQPGEWIPYIERPAFKRYPRKARK